MTVQPARPNAMAFGTRLRNDSLTGDRSDRPLLAVLLSSSRAPAGHGFPSMGCSQQYNKVKCMQKEINLIESIYLKNFD